MTKHNASCLVCGKPLPGSRKDRKTCSATCRQQLRRTRLRNQAHARTTLKYVEELIALTPNDRPTEFSEVLGHIRLIVEVKLKRLSEAFRPVQQRSFLEESHDKL